MPEAGGAAPAAGMTLAGLLVDAGAVATDRNGLAAMALIRRHKPDGAVAMLVVVPVHDAQAQLQASPWPRKGRLG